MIWAFVGGFITGLLFFLPILLTVGILFGSWKTLQERKKTRKRSNLPPAHMSSPN